MNLEYWRRQTRPARLRPRSLVQKADCFDPANQLPGLLGSSRVKTPGARERLFRFSESATGSTGQLGARRPGAREGMFRPSVPDSEPTYWTTLAGGGVVGVVWVVWVWMLWVE